MTYLLLCIFSSSFLLLLFKHLERRNIDAFQVIVANYFVAAILGLLISYTNTQQNFVFEARSLPIALIIGLLFIIVFYQIALSTKHAGVSTTTVATKMSVVIPILFSLLRYQESLSWVKILGISIALLALFLTIYKKNIKQTDPNGNGKVSSKAWIYPLIIFIGTGLVDSTIKFSQAEHIPPGGLGIFNSIVFGFSFAIGALILLIQWKKQKSKFKPIVLLYGILLGAANFGSLFFLISALNSSGLSSSVVFPLNNIGVVVLSVVSAMIIFKEKVSAINLTGVIIAIFAVILLLGN